MKIFALLVVVPLFAFAADDLDLEKKDCETEAYERYPVPNYDPQRRGFGQLGYGRMDNNYLAGVPTTLDYERARKKREQYIIDCEKEKE